MKKQISSITQRLIAAIEFITIIPLGKPATYDPGGMILFFPVVGMIVGTLVSIFDQAALRLWSPPVAAILDVVVLIILTGAFHLDGLGDTADGLLGHLPREKALAVMKDSRIGVMGLMAIACGLAIKWGGVWGLQAHRSLLLVIIPAYARASMIFGIRFLEYGRTSSGTGYDFFGSPLKAIDFSGLLIPVGLSCFLGWLGLWLNIVFAAITAALVWFYKKRIGCITGDMIGAMTEITESVLFLMVSIGGLA